MIGSYRCKIIKKKLVLYFFRVCLNYNDKGYLRLVMDMRKKLMEHMAEGLLVDTSILVDIGQIDLML